MKLNYIKAFLIFLLGLCCVLSAIRYVVFSSKIQPLLEGLNQVQYRVAFSLHPARYTVKTLQFNLSSGSTVAIDNLQVVIRNTQYHLSIDKARFILSEGDTFEGYDQTVFHISPFQIQAEGKGSDIRFFPFEFIIKELGVLKGEGNWQKKDVDFRFELIFDDKFVKEAPRPSFFKYAFLPEGPYQLNLLIQGELEQFRVQLLSNLIDFKMQMKNPFLRVGI